jgi:tRNA modification GTPase
MMSFSPDSQTIAAVATAPGRAGVGIVRVSGPDSLKLASLLFVSDREGFAGPLPYRMHHGRITDGRGGWLDDGMLCFMPGPRSFTGEDVVELHCHGCPAVLQGVLEALFQLGASPAGPGEFTKRAFLNGRMDLSQAEAVAELINASTLSGARLAGEKLKGGLAERVRRLRDHLEDLRVRLCLAVDFPEEDVECLGRGEFTQRLKPVEESLETFLAAARRAAIWREGTLVVLAGKVNAGKSSLLNALLGRERAIVAPCPGTTRDYLEEMIEMDGLPVRLVDTAGLRQADEEVELLGMQRSRELIAGADLVLAVFDSTVETTREDLAPLLDCGREKLLGVANKIDLVDDPVSEEAFHEAGVEVVRVSARHGKGIEGLAQAIRRRVVQPGGQESVEGIVAPNLRQGELLRRALEETRALQADICQDVPYDLLGVRLEVICHELSELTGDITSQEVLDAVFGSFCIGK